MRKDRVKYDTCIMTFLMMVSFLMTGFFNPSAQLAQFKPSY